jgi:hypothetical protein
VAGALSTTGFVFGNPLLQKLGIDDVCGINNLHGMPGILGGWRRKARGGGGSGRCPIAPLARRWHRWRHLGRRGG